MVTLRPILADDRERVLDILSSPDVSKTYMLPDFSCKEDALPLLNRLMDMSKDAGKYVRAISMEEKLIGFLNHIEICGETIELGYVIHPDFQGKGYMTEALKLAIEELFSRGHREVCAGAFSTNAASIRVMEKCGMTRFSKTEEIQYRGNTHICVYFRKVKI